LNFDAERCNERSALVLLALLDLGAQDAWSAARAPTLRTIEIIGTLRDQYGKNYKPNTRETIRRRTLHQFVEAGLVVINPDDSTRPVNSPKTCYRIEPAALQLARSFGQRRFHGQLERYLGEQGGLIERYARARRQEMLPVTLTDGTAVELTPGGQNLLLKQVVEQFCPRWTPRGQILYIGDAGRTDPVFEQDTLAGLGVRLNKHGKLPDLIVFLPDRNWLVLVEAASSHGPVDEKRYGELRMLFGATSAGLVLVSCFTSRGEMRRHLAAIAWETEVWCADAPSHMIHFDGEHFLGPYATEE
jgi:hypothetical protein